MDTLNFTQQVLGDVSPAFFWAMFLFAFMGMVASLLLNATDRNPSSVASPGGFSLWFLIKDNHKRIVLSLFLIFIGITVGPELTDIVLNKTTAILLGFNLDKIAQAIKNRSALFQVDRTTKQ